MMRAAFFRSRKVLCIFLEQKKLSAGYPRFAGVDPAHANAEEICRFCICGAESRNARFFFIFKIIQSVLSHRR